MKNYVPSTGETTVFVYDASGKLVAEYSTDVVPVQDAKVSYLTADHLGSPRINTDVTPTGGTASQSWGHATFFCKKLREAPFI